MDADELDNQINELDHRLDRLRSLYEQYFLGIERIEPAVARKDVDRRFWVLRKIKIRNTARRFKLQTLIQRYNTFQQHWARICREIENGTYKRQLLRAERRQGPSAAHDRDSVTPPNLERAQAARAASDAAAADLESLLDGDLDLAAEAKRALAAVLQSKPLPTSIKTDQSPAQPRATTRSHAPLGTLELDDFDLGSPTPKPPTRAQTAVPPPLTRRPVRPSATPGPAPRPEAAPVARIALKQVPVARGATEVSAIAGDPQGSDRRLPAAPRGIAAKPAAVANLALPRPTQVAAPPAPAAKPRQPDGPFRSAIGGSGRAADIFGPPASTPKTPAAANAPSPQTRGSAGLSEARVKQLHAKLVAAKSQLNDRGEVSVGGLQRQLSASYEKLQTKHRGRQIDFEVVVKDGKAVLKPKIR